LTKNPTYRDSRQSERKDGPGHGRGSGTGPQEEASLLGASSIQRSITACQVREFFLEMTGCANNFDKTIDNRTVTEGLRNRSQAHDALTDAKDFALSQHDTATATQAPASSLVLLRSTNNASVIFLTP